MNQVNNLQRDNNYIDKYIMPLLYAAVTAFFSLSGGLSFFAYVPIIILYYKYGFRRFLFAFLIACTIITVFTLIGAPEKSTPLLMGEERASEYALSNEDTQENTEIVEEAENVRAYELFLQRFYLGNFFLGGLALFCFMLFYSNTWIARVIIAVVVLLIGNIFFYEGFQAFLYQFLLDIEQTGVFGQIGPSELLRVSKLVPYFNPFAQLLLLLFNWNVAMMYLAVRIRRNIAGYYDYVYKKILSEFLAYPRMMLAIIGLIAGIIASFTFANFPSSIVGVVMGIMLLSMLIYMIFGMATSYSFISKKIAIRASLYFFLICIIMVVPLLNFAVIMLFMAVGIWRDCFIKK